ncbi:MAG: SUMF1/EgtB/PvdO family nonheme iron enzyme [Xanthomonadales bacterium]|nr:Serine/threonine-protein kinase PknD [Xanthomonadales bacterium]MCC6594701.1 SUMF1/EgtB/PvdO family nonheme iron enzyme [Xanthomonadales bacterium]MCE7932023.1 protein kinase [Xanthomonadales bacterium PRO6]
MQTFVTADHEDLGLIGIGGMAEVRRVRDRRLNRVMAMKILRADIAADAELAARFVEEAQATAQLQHPGIVPVHELGRLADGRSYFTMKEVQGRTLAEVIDAVHATSAGAAGAATADGWSLRRLIDAFRTVCDAVAYAHARGVVHRDLKPQNVMIGEFGEVLVLDWGIAMVAGRAAGFGAVRTDRSDNDAHATALGTVAGTPAYMPPEQARGEIDQIGPASDVYALGAILYQILSGQPPYPLADACSTLQEVVSRPPKPLAQARRLRLRRVGAGADATLIRPSAQPQQSPAPDAPLEEVALPPMPAPLVAACERAMAREIGERYADAAALAAEIAAWTEGARRREQALARVAQAQARLPVLADLEARAQDLAAAAQARLEALKPWDPPQHKQPAWELEDQARELSEQVVEEQEQVERLLEAALAEVPELPEAHAELARLYRRRHEQAERRGAADARRYEALLRRHDRGEHTHWLVGDGRLTLLTEPAGAHVDLHRYVERGRRRVAEPAGSLGRTPLVEVRLARGDWLLEIHAPGCARVRYPVSLGRLEHWHGCAPGEHTPRVIRLPAASSLHADEVLVPAGWFQRGGDALASGSGSAERVWLEAFAIRRHPVTRAEYQAFLDALVAAGDVEAAERWAPREQIGGPIVGRREGARILLPDTAPADAPVINLDWACAQAYAGWRGLRLLSEDEWEKAARGVDGRIYPWGDGFDATFCRMRDSVAGVSALSSVLEHPVDESPYGVRGMAGNACTWCAGGDQTRRPYRGGAWPFHQASVRSACRYRADPAYRYFGLGVRLARSLSA